MLNIIKRYQDQDAVIGSTDFLLPMQSPACFVQEFDQNARFLAIKLWLPTCSIDRTRSSGQGPQTKSFLLLKIFVAK
jgi:hypothetical protein